MYTCVLQFFNKSRNVATNKLMLYIHTLFAVKQYTTMIKMLHRFIHLQVDSIH